MDFKTKQTFRIFWQHSKKYPWAIFSLAVFLLSAIVAEIFGPLFYKELFDILGSGKATPEALFIVVLKIFAAGGFVWLFWRIASFINNFFQARVMSDILNTCFKYLQDHSYNFFSNNFAGSLVKKV